MSKHQNKRQIDTSSFRHGVWAALIAIWLLLLSGWFHQSLGTPGIHQALTLNRLLARKRQEVKKMEAHLLSLEEHTKALKKNRWLQEEEIRRVLGYVAPNELIFNFVSTSKK